MKSSTDRKTQSAPQLCNFYYCCCDSDCCCLPKQICSLLFRSASSPSMDDYFVNASLPVLVSDSDEGEDVEEKEE